MVLRVGMIGAGAISRFHIIGWRDCPGAELVAICDPDVELARGKAAEFGIAGVYPDAVAMLDAGRLDAVDIVAPVGVHALLCRLAADRGLHVMCQKPMTPDVASAQALIAAIGDRVRFMVHENYRFRPHYAQVRQWVAEGRVGRPLQARMTVRSASFVAPPGEVPFLLGRQPYLAKFPRLLIFEILIHHIDALRAILGELSVADCVTGRINPDLAGEDMALIRFEGTDGLGVVIDANVSARGYPPLPTDRLEIVGSEDTLILDRDRLWLASKPEEVVLHDLQKNYQACFSDAIAHFVARIADGKPFETDRLDNLRTLKLMEAAYAAAERQRE